LLNEQSLTHHKMNNKYLLNPVLFGIVIAMAYVSVVTAAQDALASAYAGQTSGSTRSGTADLDVAESEAGNATKMMTNQTAVGNMTGSKSALGADSHAEGEGTTHPAIPVAIQNVESHHISYFSIFYWQ